jgi:6-phosphogluconolactonase (cycloisomerase 2 family)
VAIGKTSAIKTIKLTNNTSSSIAISSITASGGFTAVPATSGGCASALGANASCTEDVFFTPTELGTVDGSVVFADASTQQYVTLTGKGSGTADSPITLTPSTLTFGNQTIDLTSVAQSVIIKNTGATSLSLTFAASGSYVKSNPGSGACSSSLGAGASCTIDVQFSPAILGAVDGSVSVSYSGANSPQVVGLTGTGVGQVTISPTSIAFSPQQVGTTSAIHKLTVTNNSSSAISVDSIVPSTDFKETNTCDGSIAVGSNCVISASFAPTRGGSLSGSIIITDSATNSPQIVDLSGSCFLVSRFAYVSNSADSIETASIYTVNLKTGQLRSNGYELAEAVQAVDPSGRFAYALGATSNTISAYAINATTGQLTQVGSPLATGELPQSITIDPSGKFVYVANQTSNNISAYTINGDTGALTPVPSSPFTSGLDPGSVAIDPTGRFAYVNNLDDSPGGDVFGYTIDPTTGALTLMSDSPFLVGSGAFALAIAPSGEFGYVSFGDGGAITVFSINHTTGVPTEVGSPFAIDGASGFSLVITPSGKFIYIVGLNSPGTIVALSVNTATGALTAVKGSPFPAGFEPSSATVDPNGTLLYVTNNGSNEVWTYTIAGDGVLTLLNKARTQQGPGPVVLAGGSTSVTYTPKFAYVANQGSSTVASSISAYTINASSGRLTAISGSPFRDGAAGTFALANSVAVDPSGRFAYVANTAGSVAEYTINSSSGALAAIPGSPLTVGSTPTAVAVDPSGRFAYVTNGGSGSPFVSAYAINTSTGALTQISGSPFTAAGANSVTVDPSGQFVYVASGFAVEGSGNISAFTINPSTGALTAVAGSPFSSGVNGPGAVAVDPSGRFAFVTAENAVPDSGEMYEMSSFAIDAATGGLTFLFPSSNLGGATNSVAADPLGQFIYATQDVVGDLVAFSFNSTEGFFSNPLTTDVCIPDALPISITVDPSGKFAYVANEGANDITACAIDETTGDLSNISGEGKVAAGVTPVSVTTTGIIH